MLFYMKTEFYLLHRFYENKQVKCDYYIENLNVKTLFLFMPVHLYYI